MTDSCAAGGPRAGLQPALATLTTGPPAGSPSEEPSTAQLLSCGRPRYASRGGQWQQQCRPGQPRGLIHSGPRRPCQLDALWVLAQSLSQLDAIS
ncbi:hypothetical protein VULLAG_LOCUS13451 [Vulpes lagopus]